MLTNLEFIKSGAQWPPSDHDTIKRLEGYEQNRKIFEGEHHKQYKEIFKRIKRVIYNFDEVISYPVILNYQKLISLKTADLLFGEPPVIGVTNKSKRTLKDQLQKIIISENNDDLINNAYMTTIDISRYGDGIFYIYEEEGKGKIGIASTSCWFPVVDPTNIKKTTEHVLAWVVIDETPRELSDQEPKAKLLVEIHEKGRYTKQEWSLTGRITNNGKTRTIVGPYQIKNLIQEEVVETNLDDFAIIQISNTTTSDRATGIDDYGDVDSILGELMVRITQIGNILDAHAAPSVEGPMSALTQDNETGEWNIIMGDFFSRVSKDDPETKYLTWDGKLDAAFQQIEVLTNQLYILSEMGAALLGDFSNTTSGQVPSGTAMRRMMMSPLAKVNRIRMRFDPALKKALALASQITKGVKPLLKSDIDIDWQDGLPADPSEQAEIESKRTGGKATSSQISSIKRLDESSQEEAEEEYKQILTDEQPIDGNI